MKFRVKKTKKEHKRFYTTIQILVDGVVVGAVQSIEINEEVAQRDMGDVGGGSYLVEERTEIKGKCQRVRFDRQRIAEVFSGGIVHAKSQRMPFQIEVVDKYLDRESINTINNVWISKLPMSYQVCDFIIVDQFDFEAENVVKHA